MKTNYRTDEKDEPEKKKNHHSKIEKQTNKKCIIQFTRVENRSRARIKKKKNAHKRRPASERPAKNRVERVAGRGRLSQRDVVVCALGAAADAAADGK